MIDIIGLLTLIFILFSIFENSLSELKHSNTEVDIKNVEEKIRALKVAKLIFLLILFIISYYIIRGIFKKWLLESIPNRAIHIFGVGIHSSFLTIISLIIILPLLEIIIRVVSKKKYNSVLKSNFLNHFITSMAKIIFIPAMIASEIFEILIVVKNKNDIELNYYLGLLLVAFILIILTFYLTPNILFESEAPEQNLPDYSSIENRETTIASKGYTSTGGGIYIYNNKEKIGSIRNIGIYSDIDPLGNNSLLYLNKTVVNNKHKCAPWSFFDTCMKYKIEKINFKKQNIKTIYDGKLTTELPGVGPAHDVDKVGTDRYLIAETNKDRIRVIDSEGRVHWMWDFRGAYNQSKGGVYPKDWTHVNDVEKVKMDNKTYYMASNRNFDSIIFINKKTRKLNRTLTLGEEDNLEILNKPHNPDYIPKRMGGPAVLVADSENDRVIEYQWEDNGWNQSWVWSDEKLDWPRDADRLPSGNTLITDTKGNRLIEINQQGEIVWSVKMDNPYEAERWGTGDESQGGESAEKIGLESRRPE